MYNYLNLSQNYPTTIQINNILLIEYIISPSRVVLIPIWFHSEVLFIAFIFRWSENHPTVREAPTARRPLPSTQSVVVGRSFASRPHRVVSCVPCQRSFFSWGKENPPLWICSAHSHPPQSVLVACCSCSGGFSSANGLQSSLMIADRTVRISYTIFFSSEER